MIFRNVTMMLIGTEIYHFLHQTKIISGTKLTPCDIQHVPDKISYLCISLS